MLIPITKYASQHTQHANYYTKHASYHNHKCQLSYTIFSCYQGLLIKILPFIIVLPEIGVCRIPCLVCLQQNSVGILCWQLKALHLVYREHAAAKHKMWQLFPQGILIVALISCTANGIPQPIHGLIIFSSHTPPILCAKVSIAKVHRALGKKELRTIFSICVRSCSQLSQVFDFSSISTTFIYKSNKREAWQVLR